MMPRPSNSNGSFCNRSKSQSKRDIVPLTTGILSDENGIPNIVSVCQSVHLSASLASKTLSSQFESTDLVACGMASTNLLYKVTSF